VNEFAQQSLSLVLRSQAAHPDQALATALAERVAAIILPALARLEERVSRVDSRVHELVPRRGLTDSTKQRHAAVVLQLGRRCPCCGLVNVVDEDGGVLDGAEFDHHWSRERNGFEDTWLLCAQCHRDVTTRRIDRTQEFAAYQRRTLVVEARGQGVLELNG